MQKFTANITSEDWRGFELHSDYRYSFQGQEKDDEIKGVGNSINYAYRMHDPRIGRFFTIDPLASKYAYNSPYAFSENRVVDAVELEGLESNGINYGRTWFGKRKTLPQGLTPKYKSHNKLWGRNKEASEKKDKPIGEPEDPATDQNEGKTTIKKVDFKTIDKRVRSQGPSTLVDINRSDENYSQTFDVPESGLDITLYALDVPDDLLITNAETGEILFKGSVGDYEFKDLIVPNTVNKVTISVTVGVDSRYDLDVTDGGTATTTITKQRVFLFFWKKIEETAPTISDDTSEGKKREVTDRWSEDKKKD